MSVNTYKCYLSPQSDSPEVKLEDIRDGVQQEIDSLCQCGFTTEHLTDSEFQCFTDLTEVTFRARLRGTVQATTSELIRYIEQWIAGGGSVLVERVRHTTDSTCQPVEVSSFSDPECGTTTESPTTESPTESPTPDDTESPTQAAQSDDTVAIIAGVVIPVVLIVAIVAITIIIMSLVLKNRRASITLQSEG